MFCFEYTVFSNKTFENKKILFMKVQISKKLRLQSLTSKEIVERRHGEPIKFLFLPKTFWAARPVMKKTLVMNYELLFRAVFSCFHGQKFNLKKIHCIVLTKKLLDTKVIFFF